MRVVFGARATKIRPMKPNKQDVFQRERERERERERVREKALEKDEEKERNE